MGINSTEVAYGFGQMGSGHIKAAATDLMPPAGLVIVAITMLADVSFAVLTADTHLNGSNVAAKQGGDGTAYFGTGTQILANGIDADDTDTVESVVVASDVVFPKGLTIYGRWTSVSLQADSTHGVICYYGPAHVGATVPAIS
tara:strand:- start:167 stop:595 length:429 start_codon:yes stop_codon:yes gene_type:complete